VASTAGGVVLTLYGLKRFSLGGLGLAATGGVLLFRGLTGYCPLNAAVGRDSTTAAERPRPLVLRTTLTVNRPQEEVYTFWRELENLPQFMHHLDEVRQLDERRSHWVAAVPGGRGHLKWEATLEADEAPRRLAWRSVPGAVVDHAGEVRFEAAPGGRGTEVHVHLSYHPPAGGAGTGAARLFNPAFERMVKEDLRRFKHVMEAGEVPTTDEQPAGE
jgi:uncharacterized membrane protein